MQTYYPGEPWPDPPLNHKTFEDEPLDAPKGKGPCYLTKDGNCRYYPEDNGENETGTTKT